MKGEDLKEIFQPLKRRGKRLSSKVHDPLSSGRLLTLSKDQRVDMRLFSFLWKKGSLGEYPTRHCKQRVRLLW
jgi:hypothetical protein